MARFDKVSKLAAACFGNKVGYFGYFSVNRNGNCISFGDNESVGTTDILYDPKNRSARVVTYDREHIEEDRFSELCKNIGVDASVEFKEYDPYVRFGKTKIKISTIPDSPLGFLGQEYSEILSDLTGID